MVKLYHYTDENGYRAIKSSRKIRKSENTTTDATFGIAVYLTGMSPRNTKMKIAENNYDGAMNSPTGAQQCLQKVAYWFEFDLPSSKVEKCRDERNVWVFKGGDLLFSEYPPTEDGSFATGLSQDMDCAIM